MSYLKHINKLHTLHIALLFGAISLSLLTFQFVQSSYAQSIKSLNVIAKFDKKVIKLGDSQTISFTVVDADTKLPVSGAHIKAVVTYPGGTIVRVLGTGTDNLGQASLSVPTSTSIQSDTVSIDIDVFLTGYTDSTFALSFAVISNNVNQGSVTQGSIAQDNTNNNNNHHHHNNNNHNNGKK